MAHTRRTTNARRLGQWPSIAHLLVALGLSLVAGLLPQQSLAPSPTPAAASGIIPTIELAGSVWTGFAIPGIGDVRVRGNYAYVAPGEGDFQIIDVRTKRKPKIVGHLAVGFTWNVEVLGQYAFLWSYGDGGGLITVDIADPSHPVHLHSPETPWPSRISWSAPPGASIGQVRASGRYLYITLYTLDPKSAPLAYDFVVLDVADPRYVTEVATVAVGVGAGTFQLYLSGAHAYVGLTFGGVAIVDISVPSRPVAKGAYRGEGPTDHPYLIGHVGTSLVMATWQSRVLYYLSGGDGTFAGNDGSPANPVDLILVDASAPTRPVRRSSYRLPGPHVLPWQAVAANNYLHVVDHRCIQCGVYPGTPRSRVLTFDVTNQSTPKLVYQYQQQARAQMISLSGAGQYLYVNEANYGLRILSIVNPARPAYVGGTPTASEGRYAWANDEQTFAYVMDSGAGTIHVIDVAEKSSPVRRGSYWDGGEISPYDKFAGRGPVLYVPESLGSVAIIDVSNPDAPVRAGRFSGFTGISQRIVLIGQYAYVTALLADDTGQYEQALFIYDIAAPNTPILQSRLTVERGATVPRAAPQIAVDGQHAYLVLPDAQKLVIVSVAAPTRPRIVSTLRDTVRLTFAPFWGEWEGRLAVARGYAYILTGEDGYIHQGPDGRVRPFHIVDVRDPLHPVYRRAFDDLAGVEYLESGDHFPNDLLISGNWLYLGAYWPLIAFALDDPLHPRYVTDSYAQGVESPFAYNQITGWSLGRLLGPYLYAPIIQGLTITRITPPPS